MPFGTVPVDEETPDFHPFVRAAAGMASPDAAAASQPAAPGGAMTAPYYGVAAPQAAAPQQSQAPSIATAPAQGNQPAAPAVVLPPSAPDPHLDRWHAMEAQLQQDSQPVQAKPKWYERLAGAAVGFGAGYKGGAAEGVREGSRVTMRGQIAADADRAGKMDADRAAMDSFRQEQQMESNAYENQIRAFDASRAASNDARDQGNKDRDFNYRQTQDKQTQANNDRDFTYRQGKDTQDQANNDRDFGEKKREFGVNSSREAANSAETARHNQVEEGLAGQRLKDDQAKATRDDKQSKMNDLVQRRDKEYDEANKEFDKQLAEAGSPEDKQEVQNRRAAKAAELQSRWNEEFSKADPNGQFRKDSSTQPSQQQAQPSKQPQQKQGQPSTSVKDYEPLPQDKVGVVMNGKYVVGPRANLQKAIARGAVEVK